jgi:hypothetical protein
MIFFFPFTDHRPATAERAKKISKKEKITQAMRFIESLLFSCVRTENRKQKKRKTKKRRKKKKKKEKGKNHVP